MRFTVFAAMGLVEVVKKLLIEGADPYQESVQGLTPKALAVERNHSAIVALFTEKD